MLPKDFRRANIKPIHPAKLCFHFFILLSLNAQSYEQVSPGYAPLMKGYPQFRKVFRFLLKEIHTSCVQRFICKYFVK